MEFCNNYMYNNDIKMNVNCFYYSPIVIPFKSSTKLPIISCIKQLLFEFNKSPA